MGFRCKVDDSPRLILIKKLRNQTPIIDTTLDKMMVRVPRELAKVLSITRVGEGIQVN
jgi:hypothetical protein